MRGFLEACQQELASGGLAVSAQSSVAVVVFTPGSDPWVGWQTTRTVGLCAVTEMAAVLLDGARAWQNGDDPVEVAQGECALRETRRRASAALLPWYCEFCGDRYGTEGDAVEHEGGCDWNAAGVR